MKENSTLVTFTEFNGLGIENRLFEIESDANITDALCAIREEAKAAGYFGAFSDIPENIFTKHGFRVVKAFNVTNQMIASDNAPPVRIAKCMDCASFSDGYCTKYHVLKDGRKYGACIHGSGGLRFGYGSEKPTWGPFMFSEGMNASEVLSCIIHGEHNSDPELRDYRDKLLEHAMNEQPNDYSEKNWTVETDK